MKSLIVYFSHTGENMVNGEIENINKGFTEIVAEKIKKYTGGELYKLEEETPYPKSYLDCVKIAKEEYENNKIVPFKTKIENLNEYDIIYLGFPIWWRGYPRIISSFIKKYDGLKGKTVIPFCTNEEGAFGMSEIELKSELKDANVKKGFAIKGHDASNSDEKLKAFLFRSK